MSRSTPKKSQKTEKTAVAKVKDLSTQPFFVKKANEAKAFLKKNGYPSTNKK